MKIIEQQSFPDTIPELDSRLLVNGLIFLIGQRTNTELDRFRVVYMRALLPLLVATYLMLSLYPPDVRAQEIQIHVDPATLINAACDPLQLNFEITGVDENTAPDPIWVSWDDNIGWSTVDPPIINGGVAHYIITEPDYLDGVLVDSWTDIFPEWAGEFIVPPCPTPTPTPTSAETPTSTPADTATATATSAETPTPTSTGTPTATSTEISTLTPTSTEASTLTPTSTGIPTPIPTSTETPTLIPASTSTGTSTPANTPTEIPIFTATQAPAATSTETANPTAADTTTATPTSTAIPTPTSTGTATGTPTPSEQSTATPTATATKTTPTIHQLYLPIVTR